MASPFRPIAGLCAELNKGLTYRQAKRTDHSYVLPICTRYALTKRTLDAYNAASPAAMELLASEAAQSHVSLTGGASASGRNVHLPSTSEDRWIVVLDRAYAVRSARGIEAEGFDCIAAARHWIAEREAEEADELAAIADCEADQIREAA